MSQIFLVIWLASTGVERSIRVHDQNVACFMADITGGVVWTPGIEWRCVPVEDKFGVYELERKERPRLVPMPSIPEQLDWNGYEGDG